jgi:hypothetical protein
MIVWVCRRGKCWETTQPEPLPRTKRRGEWLSLTLGIPRRGLSVAVCLRGNRATGGTAGDIDAVILQVLATHLLERYSV